MARAITTGGWTLLLLSAMCGPVLCAQSMSPRLRGDSGDASSAPAAQQPAPAPAPAPAPQTQPMPSVPETAPSMLQQPARDAQIVFANSNLSIRADNASLSAILRQVAARSGMKIDGLASDERVFGSFGPGAPRDVLADLLNGTAYNLVLVGDLSNGAPRELILTPASRAGGVAPTPAPTVTSDDTANDQEPVDVPPPPPPPDVPPPGTAPGTTPPPTPGVRTPQQLFEQLQRMRQNQQSQQPPVQQDSPQQ